MKTYIYVILDENFDYTDEKIYCCEDCQPNENHEMIGTDYNYGDSECEICGCSI